MITTTNYQLMLIIGLLFELINKQTKWHIKSMEIIADIAAWLTIIIGIIGILIST